MTRKTAVSKSPAKRVSSRRFSRGGSTTYEYDPSSDTFASEESGKSVTRKGRSVGRSLKSYTPPSLPGGSKERLPSDRSEKGRLESARRTPARARAGSKGSANKPPTRAGRPTINVDLTKQKRIGQEKLIGSGSGEDVRRPEKSRLESVRRTPARANAGSGASANKSPTRAGRPTINVDLTKQKRIGQEKVVGSGSGENVRRSRLPPRQNTPKTPEGRFSRGATFFDLMTYSPAVGEGSDKPRNYPGEGLKARGDSSEMKRYRDSSEMKRYRDSAPSLAESATKSDAKATTKSDAKATTKSDAKATTKPTPRKAASSTKPVRRPAKSAAKDRSRSTRDSYDPNLDPSVAVGTTARVVRGPSGLRYENAPRGKTFKKGGAIKSRGDGVALRGRTKGKTS